MTKFWMTIATCVALGLLSFTTGRGADPAENADLAGLHEKLDRLIRDVQDLPTEEELRNMLIYERQQIENEIRNVQRDVSDVKSSVDRLR